MESIYTFTQSLSIGNAFYTAALKIFLICFHDNDEIIKSLLEILTTLALSFAVWFSTTLVATELKLALQMICGAVSTGLSIYFYNEYVRGRKYVTVDLGGKVFIITGSNAGIGYETARQLVQMGATVVMACRSPDKAKEAKQQLLALLGCSTTKIHVIKLDLCGFDSVRKFVKEFRGLGLPLHGLINNAGVMMSERSLTQDGFETVFTANHLSHFLLTNLLLPDLEKTNGRIVNLTSSLHKTTSKFNCNDVMSEQNYSLFGTYAQSKLANILFTFELQRR
jgi:hypothetical protein